MKISTNGNMYEIALDEMWELFDEYLSGSRSALVCVLHTSPLDEQSTRALNSSTAALGYGNDACTFVNTTALDAQALFMLLEGLDPMCLIAADEPAAHALEKAYRTTIATGKPSRVFGRTCVAFTSFSALLDDAQDKQVAWALLKKLPRYANR